MKNIVTIGAIALTTSLAIAGSAINFKKVNSVIKSVVETEVTPLIHKIEVKFDEKSKIEDVKKMKAGITLSAGAKESVWSKKESTVDVALNLKTVNSDAAHTKVQFGGTFSSKTEAVPLYAYLATQWLKGMADEVMDSATDEKLMALLKEASETTSLDKIPNQLERFIAIIKEVIAELPPEQQNEEYVTLLNSLVVDTKIQNFETKEVILKTTTEVAIDFFDVALLISDFKLSVSTSGLSVGLNVATTTETAQAQELLTSLTNTLKAIEKADAETLAGLRDMTQGYIHMVESIVKGEE